MANINELLSGHVTLDVECIDRLYLNGYIPELQMGGQLASFLVAHRGNPIPSPALLGKMTTAFKTDVESFVAAQGLQIVPFERSQRKDDIAAEHRARTAGGEGVYLVGVAQERAMAFKATKHTGPRPGFVGFEFCRQSVCVNHYYFYLIDDDFGPAFIKIGTYAPFPIKVYLNGHEWAKRQLTKEGIGFEALDNGFFSCEDPQRLQQICDSLGPQQIEAFFEKWLSRLPLPLSAADRGAGFEWRLSIWQMEVSRTQVFARPARGRQFFEEVIRENIDLGRPERIQLVFDRKIIKSTPGSFRTRVIQQGVHPSLHVEYKSCHLKQYFKENRALRTETTINDTKDFGIGRSLGNLPELQQIARTINRRLLDVQRVSQDCTLEPETIEQVTQPTITQEGQRVPGLRLGHPRTMALLMALILFIHLPQGFSNRSLRVHVADLLGPDARYGTSQMTYDLRRLLRKGLIHRRPNSHSYTLTPHGRKVALFLTKLEARVFRPANASLADPTDISRPLANALNRVDQAIAGLLADAQLRPAP